MPYVCTQKSIQLSQAKLYSAATVVRRQPPRARSSKPAFFMSTSARCAHGCASRWRCSTAQGNGGPEWWPPRTYGAIEAEVDGGLECAQFGCMRAVQSRMPLLGLLPFVLCCPRGRLLLRRQNHISAGLAMSGCRSGGSHPRRTLGSTLQLRAREGVDQALVELHLVVSSGRRRHSSVRRTWHWRQREGGVRAVMMVRMKSVAIPWVGWRHRRRCRRRPRDRCWRAARKGVEGHLASLCCCCGVACQACNRMWRDADPI